MTALEALRLESVWKVSANEVMSEAWRLAKLVASEYGVSSKSLLAAALKKVWASVLVKVSIFNAYAHRQILTIIGFSFNEETKSFEKDMRLGEFKNPKSVKFGKGFKTSEEIKRAYNHKHSLKFI